jgi:hypothetical protein
MQEHRDIFCSTMDECNSGMLGRLRILADLLVKEDVAIGEHFEKIGLKTDYFAVRWITLMLAQEFDLGSVQVLWDAILSDQSPTSVRRKSSSPLLHYVCVAMIIKVKDVLLAGDFTDCMNTLQRYPPFDVKELIALALKLRRGSEPQTVLDASASGMSVVLDQEILACEDSGEQQPSSPRTLSNLFRLVKNKFRHQPHQ